MDAQSQLGSSNLLDNNIDLISVLHAQFLGGLSLVKSLSVEEESNVGDVELHRKGGTLWRWQ